LMARFWAVPLWMLMNSSAYVASLVRPVEDEQDFLTRKV
jgi:hypothetical protein